MGKKELNPEQLEQAAIDIEMKLWPMCKAYFGALFPNQDFHKTIKAEFRKLEIINFKLGGK